MAQNKNTLIRFKTIDKCLQNQNATWSLDDLINECSKALSIAEGKEVIISKRSIQLDIQMMRSSENGYNAPIEVYERKYYRYTDENFSITKLPITTHDKKLILACLDVIAQYEGFTYYSQFENGLKILQVGIQEEKANVTEKVVLEVDKSIKSKVLKKPLHKSQKVKQEKKNGNVILQFKVKNISKFKKKLVQFGKGVKVVST